MNRIKLNEDDLKRIVLKILEQDQQEEKGYFRIEPKKFIELMMMASFNGEGLTKSKIFKGKPIIVTGDLNISNTPTNSLGNVVKIEGNLDLYGTPIESLENLKKVEGNLNIRKTNISNISGVEVEGRVDDYDTPISRARERKIYLEKLAEAQNRRDDGEWSLDYSGIDYIGLKANALYEHLVNEGEIEGMDSEESERLNEIQRQVQELSDRYDNEEDPEIADQIYDQISDLETEMEEIQEKGDVYNIIPEDYDLYGLTTFEVIDLPNQEYAVGTDSEMDKAAYGYAVNYLDEVGVDGFSGWFINDHINGDEVADYFRDWWRDDIYESPESYFTEDDYEISEEQEQMIEDLENSISEYEEQQNEDGISDDEYDELQELIDDLQEKLDEIEPDTEPTEDMVEEKLEELISDVESDPLQYIKDYDLDVSRFVDEEGLAEGLVQSDGYGILNSYDGSYDVVEINGEDFYIIRLN